MNQQQTAQGANIYSAFHDWRAALMDAIARDKVHADYLRVLRNDMQRTIELIETEMQRRATVNAQSAEQ